MAKNPSQKPSPPDQFLAAIEAADVSAVKKLIAEGRKPTADAAVKAADLSNRAHAVCHQKAPTLFGRMPTAKQIAKAEVESLAGFEMVEALLAAGTRVPERLCSAACAGNTRLALLLIQRGADVNYDPPMGTPLENAVKAGDVEILRALIKAGADVTHQKYFGPVLARAVEANSLTAAEELIRAGADVKLKPKFGPRVLMKAVSENRKELVELFLRHGADVDAQDGASIGEFGEPEVKIEGMVRTTHLKNPEYVREATPLIVSVRKGFADITKLLVAAKADLDAVDSNGLTAMAYAVKAKDEAMIQLLSGAGAKPSRYAEGSRDLAWIDAAKKGDVVRLQDLLKDGADVNLKYSSSTEEEEGTALTHAAENGRLDAVRWLLNSGARVDEKCGNSGEEGSRTALMHAARCGHSAVAEALISAGASAVSRDKGRLTPLHYAAQKGHAEVIRGLVKAGAQVKATDRGGSTPLMEAAGEGHTAATRALLELKADANARTKDGFTALFGAAQSGHKEVVQLLLEHGARVSVPDSDFSPLEAASSSGRKAIVNLLLNADKEQNQKAGKAATKPDGQALISAVMSGKTKVVNSLLDLGADPNSTMDGGAFTALMMAVRVGRLDTVKMLLEAGADVNAISEGRKTALDLAHEGIKIVKDQLKFLGTMADNKERQEINKLRTHLLRWSDGGGKAADGEDQLTTLLRAAGGKRGKELKGVRAPKRKEPEPEPDGRYEDLPIPDFKTRAKADDFQKAIRELETLCGAKARAISNEEGHPWDNCVRVEVATEQADKILAGHHEAFLQRGHYLLKSSRGYASGKDQLALLPTDKRSEVFAAFGTNGANSNQYPADIVRCFDELEKSQPYLLTGAGHDWCEGRFTRPIKDSKQLAKKMYEFCSDIVDQGVGDIARLALELKKTQRFFFWWD